MTKAKQSGSNGKVAAALDTPTDLSDTGGQPRSRRRSMAILADTFALFLKTKNFHWHVSGPRFRDLHLLFDEQAAADSRHHRRDRRARPQDWRHDAALHRSHFEAAEHRGQ